MKYDIYFHSDFDGVASAAVMLDFLRSRGDDIEHYVPVGYHLLPEWLKEDFFANHKLFKGKRNPAIVVDFLYHPQAVFWLEHHPTTFQKESWRRNFRPSKSRYWGAKYQSCCHLVVDVLAKNFGYRVPRHLRELARWLDVIDGANYKSVRQWLEMKEPALQIDAFVDETEGSEANTVWVIKELSRHLLKEIIKQRRVGDALRSAKSKLGKAIKFYEGNTIRRGKHTTFIDLTRGGKGLSRFKFLAYLHPRVLYAVRLFRKDDGLYHVGAGVNLWRKSENRINIGNLMTRYKGGGGHKGVGAAEFKSKKAAEKAIREIIGILK
jgi:oligoribonuclease NrnB/cAMP/cGMP phosphodiesterase (DHH superfamily)